MENPFPRLLGSASVVNGVNCDHYQLRLKGDKKKNLTKVFGHISALQAPTEKNTVFFQVPFSC